MGYYILDYTIMEMDQKEEVTMSWLDNTVNENKGVEFIGGRDFEVKCGQGILAYIREQDKTFQEKFEIKDLEEIFKQFDKQPLSRKPQWFMSYGEVISYHKSGLLKDIMESYELCIGTKSLDSIREHYGE